MDRRYLFVVDCEFNSMNGELLSMAIVPLWPSETAGDTAGSREFYEVLEHDHLQIHPWVAENVIPVMNKTSVNMQNFQINLERFLKEHHVKHLYFDWPDDIAYFSRALITGPGTRIKVPGNLRMEFVPGINCPSEVPHNALHDARGVAWSISRLLTEQTRRALAH